MEIDPIELTSVIFNALNAKGLFSGSGPTTPTPSDVEDRALDTIELAVRRFLDDDHDQDR